MISKADAESQPPLHLRHWPEGLLPKSQFSESDYILQLTMKLSLVTKTFTFLQYQLPKNVPQDKRMMVFKTFVKFFKL